MGVDIRDRGTDVSTGAWRRRPPGPARDPGCPAERGGVGVRGRHRRRVRAAARRGQRDGARTAPHVDRPRLRRPPRAHAGGLGVAPSFGRARAVARRPRGAAEGPEPATACRRCWSWSPTCVRGCSCSARTARPFASGATARRSRAVRDRVTCLVWVPERRGRRDRDLPHRLSELRPAGGARVLLRRRTHPPGRTRRIRSGAGRVPVLPRERQRLADRVVAPSRRVPEVVPRRTAHRARTRSGGRSGRARETGSRPAAASPATRPRPRDRTAPPASRRGHPARPAGLVRASTGARSRRSRATRSVRRWPPPDVSITGRSFKYHRARGLFCMTGGCPNCLMQVDGIPNVRSCTEPVRDGMRVERQNAWPSVDHDIHGWLNTFSFMMPPGFYYKIFHRPRWAWKTVEPFIRSKAGLGKAPKDADHEPREVHNLHADVLVIGAGPAGLAAAAEAANAGASTVVLEERAEVGRRWRRAGGGGRGRRARGSSPGPPAFGVFGGPLIAAANGDRLVPDPGAAPGVRDRRGRAGRGVPEQRPARRDALVRRRPVGRPLPRAPGPARRGADLEREGLRDRPRRSAARAPT